MTVLKRLAVGAALIAVGAMVFAVGSKDSSGGKVLNWTTQGEITTMDSGKGFDTLSWEQIEFFNESYYKIDGGNNPVPALAASLPVISADGITLTITLRDGIKFSDGSAITAADFVYAARRVVDPATGSQSASRLSYLKNASDIIAGKQPATALGIKALAPNKVEITLTAPNPYITLELASSVVSPLKQSFVEAQGAKYALSSDALLASGPFVLKDWAGANISWKYVKNPHYWDAKNVYFDEINIQVVKEIATGIALYEDGKLDGVRISGEHLSVYRGTPDLLAIPTLRMTNLELGISATKALQNLNIRKALLLGVDRDELATAILNGDGVPAVGAVPNGIATNPANGKSIKDDWGVLVTYNPAQAAAAFRQGLRELGLTSLSLRLVTSDAGENVKIGQYLQSVYQKNLPGLTIDLANVPASVRFQEMMSYNFVLALGGWTGEFNPTSYPKQFETSNEHNHGKWVSAELTALVNQLETQDGTNFNLRWQHLQAANKYIIDNVVTVPLVQASQSFLVNPKLKGHVVHVLGTPIDVTKARF